MNHAIRIVILGGGFAGHRAARALARALPDDAGADIVLVNPTDYFLYLPLLPEVAAAVLDPRSVTVSLPETLPKVRLTLGNVSSIDLDHRRVAYTDPEAGEHVLGYDRLIVAVGSVNKLLPIPGVGQRAHGFRGVPEAIYLRDHVIRQVELAADSDDPEERDARCTFVVVGAGYTGTEVAAHASIYTDILHARHPRLREFRPQWYLIDIADRVLPELDPRLSATARKVLASRRIEVLTGTSVKEAMASGVMLSDGRAIPTRSLIWCVGVRPDPLIAALGLDTARGRLCVDMYLQVPGCPGVYACGDAAAVPDLTRPGQYTAMTAQHAVRQGRRVARNIAAAYGEGTLKPYKHRDLGFVVDLGGRQAAANPLGVPLGGIAAKTVTRGYHLLSLQGNRIRTATEWLLDTVLPRQTVQLGLVRSPNVPLDPDRPEFLRPSP
jgi:NADH:ubiquinone reductase (H+-translocating)